MTTSTEELLDDLTPNQFLLILDNDTFKREVRNIKFRLHIEDYEASELLLDNIVSTNRVKHFYSISDSVMTPKQNAQIAFASKTVCGNYFTERTSKIDNEVSIQGLQDVSLDGGAQFDITYDDSDVMFKYRPGQFSQNERRLAFDNIDYILTKPSAKFVKYLISFGDNKTMQHYNLTIGQFNHKVNSIIDTLGNPIARAKIDACHIITDDERQHAELLKKLQSFDTFDDEVIDDFKDFIIQHWISGAYDLLYVGLTFDDIQHAVDNWDETIYARKIEYKLSKNLDNLIAYIESYIYY